MKKTAYFLFAYFLIQGISVISAKDNRFIHQFDNQGTVLFVLSEKTHHPYFWWPKSLLNYNLLLKGRNDELSILQLSDQDGKPFLFQLSDIKYKNELPVIATLNFSSDLPTDKSWLFILKPGPQKTESAPYLVKIAEEGGSYILETGKSRVSKSLTVNTNQATELKFKRQSGYQVPPYLHQEQVLPRYYS